MYIVNRHTISAVFCMIALRNTKKDGVRASKVCGRVLNWPAVFVILTLVIAPFASSAGPNLLGYQGYLTDTDGAAIEGPTIITFRLYTQPAGGVPIWSEARQVFPDRGLFSVNLGEISPLDAGLFSVPLFLGLQNEAGPEMQPRSPLTTVGFSFRSNDADRLQGRQAFELDESDLILAEQTAREAAIDLLAAGLAEEASARENGDQQTNADLNAIDVQVAQLTALVGALQSQIALLQTQIAASDTTVASLQAELIAVQQNSVLALDGILTLEDNGPAPAILGQVATFNGVNVQIQNGEGITNSGNGFGNLIVGYNEFPDGFVFRGGSHNVIVGAKHNFSSYGGAVLGLGNSQGAAARYGSVIGGTGSEAGAQNSVVVGGFGNTTNGLNGVVIGGRENVVTGQFAVTVGGVENRAAFSQSVAVGGAIEYFDRRKFAGCRGYFQPGFS